MFLWLMIFASNREWCRNREKWPFLLEPLQNESLVFLGNLCLWSFCRNTDDTDLVVLKLSPTVAKKNEKCPKLVVFVTSP